jgi:DNA helicase MCM9
LALTLYSQHKPNAKQDQMVKPLWPLDKLQVYFSYVKAAFAPDMTPDSQEVLQMYYRKQRATDQRNAARTTLRLLESMIRLSQGTKK